MSFTLKFIFCQELENYRILFFYSCCFELFRITGIIVFDKSTSSMTIIAHDGGFSRIYKNPCKSKLAGILIYAFSHSSMAAEITSKLAVGSKRATT